MKPFRSKILKGFSRSIKAMGERGGIESLVQALSHDKRRQIIALLAEEGPLGVTELRSKLNLSTGSLYHNLGFLSGYIEREGKKYKLNSAGMELYRTVRAGSVEAHMGGFGLIERLMPVGQISMLYDSNWAWVFAAVVAAVLLASSYLWKIGLVLLAVGGPWFESSYAVLSTVVSIVMFTAVASMSFRTIRLIEFVPLAIASFTPQAVCSVALGLVTIASPLKDVVMLATAGVGILTSASAVKVSSGTRTEYALIFSFIAVYLGTAVMPMVSSLLTSG